MLRGIDQNTVWLVDPSVGNRTYSKAQFLEVWHTRDDKDNVELAGKFLAVMPNKEGITAGDDFFRNFRKVKLRKLRKLRKLLQHWQTVMCNKNRR